jgi:large conductance mechanosensitive channel
MVKAAAAPEKKSLLTGFKELPEAPAELTEVDLLAEIRDLLIAQREGSASSADAAGGAARTVARQRDGKD